MELTKVQCKSLGIDVTSSITVVVTQAGDLPGDLKARIVQLGLTPRWERLSKAKRRAYAAAVFEAKRPDTRRARVDRVLAALEEM